MAKAKFSPKYKLCLSLLIKARKSAGLRQQDVAQVLKRPQSYVSKIESGERRLDVGEFIELADAIGVDPVRIVRKLVEAGQ